MSEKTKYVAEWDWMRGHYHCPKCGGEMECWKSFGWEGHGNGVSRLGGCEKCGKYMIEYEKGDNLWLEPKTR